VAQREKDRIVVDGSRFADLAIGDFEPKHKNLWAFLTETVPWHPWIAGLAAIVGIVAFGAEHEPWVLSAAIIGVTLITVTSTWNRTSHELPKAANELGHVTTDTRAD